MNVEQLLEHYGTVSAVPVLQELLRTTQQNFHQGQILWGQLVKKLCLQKQKPCHCERSDSFTPDRRFSAGEVNRQVSDVKKSQRSERIRFQ